MGTKPKPLDPDEVIEAHDLVIVRAEPGSIIEANFAAVAAHIAKLVEDYQGVEVTPEYLPQAKRDRAYLNGLSKSLNQRRLDIKREYMAPVVAFELAVKELDAPILAASTAIDTQVKGLEERERMARRAECVKHYHEYAGALVEAVPFERIEEAAWSQKSAGLMSAFEAIEARVDRIASDDKALDGLRLSHAIEAKAEYLATLDLSRAIARSGELDAQIERARQLEESKQEYAREQAALAAPEALPAPITPPAPEALAAPEVRTWVLTIDCTRPELDSALCAIKTLGLTGTVREA
ncbi:MAG: DUF1351 domain-containing protein [Coriobacteriia bacterium]|nr:DUF1351 domain-containing protein [Coriobacteriia bacterium]